MYKVPQVSISFDNHDLYIDRFSRLLSEGWLSEGSNVKEFVEKLGEWIKPSDRFLVPNGTLAIYLALLALKEKFGTGDVLVPSFTFFGSVSPIVLAGFNPVFVDCSQNTLQSEFENYMEERTRETVGIVLVHIYGQISNDAERIYQWAQENDVFVIEDSAQALGAARGGKTAGEFSDISTFSTFSDKALPTGEGGVIAVNNKELSETVKLIRNQGRLNSGTFDHEQIGMNFRITEMQALFGVVGLKDYKENLIARRKRYSNYLNLLVNKDASMKFDDINELVPFRFPVMVNEIDEVIIKLESAGYQTRRMFKPMHLQKPLKRFFKKKGLPNSELVYSNGLCLPVHRMVKDEHIEEQMEIINKFYA